MSNEWPFSLLNDEQMSNKVGVEHQPVVDKLPTSTGESLDFWTMNCREHPKKFEPWLTKNFRYLEWRVSWTLCSAILGVGFPLHKPYPYSLYRWGFLHFRYLKCLVIGQLEGSYLCTSPRCSQLQHCYGWCARMVSNGAAGWTGRPKWVGFSAVKLWIWEKGLRQVNDGR